MTPPAPKRAPAWRILLPLAAIACLSGCGLGLQGMAKLGSQIGPTYKVRAIFSNVLNLPDDAQVRYGPAVIGEVGSISTADFQADLTLDIRNGVRLPEGTTAEVRFDSPLGDEYVLLTPPAPSLDPHWLAAGATLPESATSTAPSVEDTLVALSTVLNGGGLTQLQTIVSQLNATFTGNQTELRSFLPELTSALTSLSAHKGDLDAAIASIGKLSASLNAGSNVIAQGIAAIAPATQVLAGENTDLRSLLTQLTKLSSVADSIITESGLASINDAKQLLPVVNQLVGVEAQIGPDLQDIADFESSTSKVAPGNYLQVSVTLHVLLNSNPESPTVGAATISTDPSGTFGAAGPGGSGAAGLLESSLP